MSINLDPKTPSGDLKDKWDKHKFESKLVNPANKRKFTVIVVGTGLAGDPPLQHWPNWVTMFFLFAFKILLVALTPLRPKVVLMLPRTIQMMETQLSAFFTIPSKVEITALVKPTFIAWPKSLITSLIKWFLRECLLPVSTVVTSTTAHSVVPRCHVPFTLADRLGSSFFSVPTRV